MRQTSDLPDWQVGPRSQALIGGRFQLLDEIGLGATAIVYKARDTSSGEVVALKVLKGSAAIHPRLSAGFKREAEIGRTIRHPHVIQIQDCGVHGPWIYLVMEYVTGRTLAEILSLSHRMSMAEFEPMCLHLLDALDCVHANGIVHRDLKPANLMVTQGGNWKLMDFGISRRLDSHVTAGPALGTPDYMSPEQLMGESTTPLSDLFATGAVLFEALTGTVPFKDWRLIDRCTKQAPRLRDYRPGAPQWLDNMIARCLAPKSVDRYGSALEMLAELGSFEETAESPKPGSFAGLAVLNQAVSAHTVDEHPPKSAAATALAPATASPAPAPPPLVIKVDDSKALADFLTDVPGNAGAVLGLFLDLLQLLQQNASAGSGQEPLTPWTVRILPSGKPNVWAHNPTGAKDTLTVESPKYASPEMLRGHAAISNSERIQSHLYSIGFMLYENLLGRQKFRSEFAGLDDEGSGLGWMMWHSDSAKSLRPLIELVPTTPPMASSLIAQMTSKDPAKRPADYVDAIKVLQNVLHRVQATQQIILPQQQATAPAAKESRGGGWSRGKVILLILGIVLLAAIVVAGVLLSRR